MYIRNLLYYPCWADYIVHSGLGDIIKDHLLPHPADEQDDSQEKSKTTVVDSQKNTELLDTFWLQQDGDAQNSN